MSKAISLTDELNFTKPEELEEWLKDKPVEWAQVIVVRTTLRVLPLAGTIYQTDNLSDGDKDRLILLTCRACFISSSARRSPAEDMTTVARVAADAADADYAAAGTVAYAPDAADAAFAAFASAYVAADATNAADASNAVARVAANAAGAANAANAAAAANAEFWNTISHDANWLTSRLPISNAAELLMNTRLWPDGEPIWINKERSNFTHALMDQSKYHQVWIDWYNNVLNGKPFFDLSPAREKKLTLKIAKQENEFWEQDFAKVSKDISEWLEDMRKRDAKRPDSHELDRWKLDLLEVPMPYPATLQPEWHKGKLVLPSPPLDDDLKGASINAALSALKSDFSEFVSEIGNDANIDQRASAYLSKIADDIPLVSPPQDKLFSLAHKEAFFTEYAKTVSEEWPEFLAAQFYGLGLQFSRVMQQFPEWREFKANADQKQFSSAEIEKIEQLANLMERGLREELAKDFIGQGIADIVADMAQQLATVDSQISPEQADAFIQSGKDLLAADLLTSLNNLVKRIAEAMLAKLQPLASYSKEIVGLAFKGANKKLRENSEKLGEEVVDGIFKWGKRLFKISVGATGTAVAGASAVGATPLGQWLITNYPTTFSWLEPILKLFV